MNPAQAQPGRGFLYKCTRCAILVGVKKKWRCFPQRHFNPNTNRVNGKSVYSADTANFAATALPAGWWLYLSKYSSTEYVYSLQRL